MRCLMEEEKDLIGIPSRQSWSIVAASPEASMRLRI